MMKWLKLGQLSVLSCLANKGVMHDTIDFVFLRMIIGFGVFMNIEETMYIRLKEFIENRYPKGWGGGAIMKTEQGSYLISVALESANAGAGLCMETGAMCEAQKLKENITHSLCLTRDDENAPFKVLTPCGICQERLLYWGGQVLVGITK